MHLGMPHAFDRPIGDRRLPPGKEHMAVERSTRISVIDVIDRVVDKGIVIEYEAHVSMLGIDLWTTIEGHVVMASIDTFIRYAPALRKTERLLARFPE